MTVLVVDPNAAHEKSLLGLSAITQISIFVFEILDFLQDGPLNYLKSGWNLIDLTGCVSFFAYWYKKTNHIENDKYAKDVSFENQVELLECIIMFMMVCKINFYLRIYPRFG